MGQDGARGAAALHRRQSPVLVQDPATCVVDGMPRSAMAAVPTARVMGLHDIASTLAQWCARPGPGPTGRRHE
jgi:two-component system chemotaxis response regulator CheB